MTRRFTLKEATITIRDTEVRVRELTHAERAEVAKASEADKRSAPYVVASLGLISPAMTVEEAKEEPAEVLEEIVVKIMQLSGMQSKGKTPEKESDAR